jgi:hypothetical protein
MLLPQEIKMARANLGSMSVEALLELRDEVGKVLNQKAVQLQSQLSMLGGKIKNRGRQSFMNARKCLSNIATRRVTPGQAVERNPSGCGRNSRLVRSSKTLQFKRQRLLAKLPRGKQRSGDARSDEGCR